MFTTALGEGEILTAIEVPALGPNTGSAYTDLTNPASRYAMVGAAAIVQVDGGNFGHASVAIGSLTPTPRLAPSVERALTGRPANAETIAAAAEAVANDLGDDILSDIHASADYRRAMAPVFVRRALQTALERA
jgi:carbon-monoxide dehydrogenase medium subunit